MTKNRRGKDSFDEEEEEREIQLADDQADIEVEHILEDVELLIHVFLQLPVLTFVFGFSLTKKPTTILCKTDSVE